MTAYLHTPRSVRGSEDATRPYVDPRSTRKEPVRMSRPTLFDHDPSPRSEEYLLASDLQMLVSMGLLEPRPSSEGTVYVLTDLGRDTPEFGT